MNAQSVWKHDDLYETSADSGHRIVMDAGPSHAQGPTPMEAVLMALCSCTSVDVVSILRKKREPLEGLRVSATAQQAPAPPRTFTQIHLTYTVSGKVSRSAAESAISLSKNKYCSVSKMLEKAAAIDYEIVFADGEPQP